MSKRLPWYEIDNEKKQVRFVPEKMTEEEIKKIKVISAIGYTIIPEEEETFRPEESKEKKYTKEEVGAFLGLEEKKELKKEFEKKKNEDAIDKETGKVKKYKNGKTKKKGFFGAMAWLKKEKKDEYKALLKFVEKTREEAGATQE